MIRLLLFSLVTLALAALPTSLWGGGNEAHVQLTRAGALSGGEPATETYEVLSPMKRLQVHLTLNLEGGAAEWQLRDPDGVVRWEGDAGAGDAPEEREFAAVVGDWTLTITPTTADGRYVVRWRGDS